MACQTRGSSKKIRLPNKFLMVFSYHDVIWQVYKTNQRDRKQRNGV